MTVYSCISIKKQVNQNVLPNRKSYAVSLAPKDDFYLYIMAGQSNMAGRGIIEANDTLTDGHILTLDINNQWVLAKEPLHEYEPARIGLDCGLSFAQRMNKRLGDKITIGMIPCAIGGSSVEQWLYDSTYRKVTLYTNLITKINYAKEYGTIKGMIWHQGESNATARNYVDYKSKLETLFSKIRNDIHIPDLPILMGELGPYLPQSQFPLAEKINQDLHSITRELNHTGIISTKDFTPKSDTIHFDSNSLRKMGRRYADKMISISPK